MHPGDLQGLNKGAAFLNVYLAVEPFGERFQQLPCLEAGDG